MALLHSPQAPLGYGWSSVGRRYAQDFLRGRHSRLQLGDRAFAQRFHSHLASHLPEHGIPRSRQDCARNRVVYRENLVNGGSAAVAGVGTNVATQASVQRDPTNFLGIEPNPEQRRWRRHPSLAAVRTDLADQPLRHDDAERSRDQKRLDPHVQEPGDRRGRIVGVKRGKQQVAGERRLDGDFGRFVIADLADHDDVGILTEKGSQARSKRETGCLVHLHLADATHAVLDRILSGRDVDDRAVELFQDRIESRGFS